MRATVPGSDGLQPSEIHFMVAGPDGAICFTAQPVGITRGIDGALWFAETHANKIGRITPSGVISQYNVPFTGGRPADIVSGPDARTLWFTDIGTQKIGCCGGTTDCRNGTFGTLVPCVPSARLA